MAAQDAWARLAVGLDQGSVWAETACAGGSSGVCDDGYTRRAP